MREQLYRSPDLTVHPGNRSPDGLTKKLDEVSQEIRQKEEKLQNFKEQTTEEINIQLKVGTGFNFYKSEEIQENKDIKVTEDNAGKNKDQTPPGAKNINGNMVLPTNQPPNASNKPPAPISFFVTTKPPDNQTNKPSNESNQKPETGQPTRFFGSKNQDVNKPTGFMKASELAGQSQPNQPSEAGQPKQTPKFFQSLSSEPQKGTNLNLMGTTSTGTQGVMKAPTQTVSQPKNALTSSLKTPLPPKLQNLPATDPFVKEYLPWLESQEKLIMKHATSSSNLAIRAKNTLARRKLLADKEVQSFESQTLKRFNREKREVTADCVEANYALMHVQNLIVEQLGDDLANNNHAEACKLVRKYLQNAEKIETKMESSSSVLDQMLFFLEAFNEKLDQVPKRVMKSSVEVKNKVLDFENEVELSTSNVWGNSKSRSKSKSKLNKSISISQVKAIPGLSVKSPINRAQNSYQKFSDSLCEISRIEGRSIHQSTFLTESIDEMDLPTTIGILFSQSLKLVEIQLAEISALQKAKSGHPLSLQNRKKAMNRLIDSMNDPAYY